MLHYINFHKQTPEIFRSRLSLLTWAHRSLRLSAGDSEIRLWNIPVPSFRIPHEAPYWIDMSSSIHLYVSTVMGSVDKITCLWAQFQQILWSLCWPDHILSHLLLQNVQSKCCRHLHFLHAITPEQSLEHFRTQVHAWKLLMTTF